MTPQQYLQSKGLKEETIQHFGLRTSSDRIAIPIRDEEGKHLFTKYRMFVGDRKYLYDTGATMELFNSQVLAMDGTVWIVEGEMDAMVMHQLGYISVSTTGGSSSSFDRFAALFLGRDVVIMYDNDAAGRAGAQKVAASLCGHASSISLATLPDGLKDIGEAGVGAPDAMHNAIITPWAPSSVKTKKREPFEGYNFCSGVLTPWSYPIDQIVSVPSSRKLPCPFHREKTASLHVFKDHAYCFGCAKYVTAVDVVMEVYGKTRAEAIDMLKRMC